MKLVIIAARSSPVPWGADGLAAWERSCTAPRWRYEVIPSAKSGTSRWKYFPCAFIPMAGGALPPVEPPP
jgi:hypothetical protein